MAVIFGLLLGVGLLLGILVFRSRCCSCPSPPTILVPLPGQKPLNAAATTLPPPSTKAPVCPSTHPVPHPLLFLGKTQPVPTGPLRWSGDPEEAAP